jgi:hypothetical protein
MPAVFPSAVGPTLQSAASTPTSAQIFYAENITGSGVGHNDTVTVTFTCVSSCGSPSISAGGIVAVEYSGLDQNYPLDSVSAGYSYSAGSYLDSGTAAPANANLLLFGGGTSDAGTAGVGTNFTVVQKNTGSVTEDEVVSSNNVLQRATACLGTCPAGTTSGDWVMQMAVFRAASWGLVGGSPVFVGQGSVTNSGVFTGSAYTNYLSSTVGGWSTSLYTTGGPEIPNNLDATMGAVVMPSGLPTASSPFANGNGIAGYCVNEADTRENGMGHNPGFQHNCVDLYGVGRAQSSNSSIWHINGSIGDVAGTTDTYIVYDEADIGVNGEPEDVQGLDFFLGGTGTMPANGAGIQFFNTGQEWPNAIIIGPGSANQAMQIYPQSRGTSASPTPINWIRYDSNDIFHADGSIEFDSFGDFVFQHPSGSSLQATNFQAIQGTACASGNVTMSGWGTSAMVTQFSGYSQTCQFTIASGSAPFSAAPTITFTFPNAFPSIPVCTLDVHAITGSGGAIMFANHTPSATAPVFTATTNTGAAFTPVPLETYTVVLRCGP